MYESYAEFLAADPRRRGDALELGADWEQDCIRHRACWYEHTGEVTLERLSDSEPVAMDDFHQGVSGQVEILRHVATREELARLLGAWPNIAPREPRTVRRLRKLLTDAASARTASGPLRL